MSTKKNKNKFGKAKTLATRRTSKALHREFLRLEYARACALAQLKRATNGGRSRPKTAKPTEPTEPRVEPVVVSERPMLPHEGKAWEGPKEVDLSSPPRNDEPSQEVTNFTETPEEDLDLKDEEVAFLALDKEGKLAFLAEKFQIDPSTSTVDEIREAWLRAREKSHATKDYVFFVKKPGEDFVTLFTSLDEALKFGSGEHNAVLRGLVHRSSEKIGSYNGILPLCMILAAGDRPWEIVIFKLGMPPDEYLDDPIYWVGGKPVSYDVWKESSHRLVADVALAAIKTWGRSGSLELPVTRNGRLSVGLIHGDPSHPILDEEGKLVGYRVCSRIEKALGIEVLEGTKPAKRVSQLLRVTQCRLSLRRDEVRLIKTTDIPRPKDVDALKIRINAMKRQIDLMRTADRAGLLEGEDILELPRLTDQYVRARVAVILEERGCFNDDEKMRKTYSDGGFPISSSFRRLAVNQMREDNRIRNLGYQKWMIEEVAKGLSFNFRSTICGHLKGQAFIADWLPDGYIVTHPANIKDGDMKEVPGQSHYHFWFDLQKPKETTNLHRQMMLCQTALFPPETVKKWMDKQCEEYLAEFKEKGVVDTEESIQSLLDDHEESGGATFARRRALVEWSCSEFSRRDPFELPALAASAAVGKTFNWANLREKKFRVQIEAAVHYQLISEFLMLLIDPDAPRVENPKAVRFHPRYKVAYVKNDRYVQATVDHGGADQDDFVDFLFRYMVDSTGTTFTNGEGKPKVFVVRLRTPNNIGEYGLDELEGNLPESIKGKELPTLSTKVFQELGLKKSHPNFPSPKVTVELPEKDPERANRPYGMEPVLELLGVAGLHPGRVLNLIMEVSANHKDWYFKNPPPLAGDGIIDPMTQAANKEDAEEIEKVVTDWWMESITLRFNTYWYGSKRTQYFDLPLMAKFGCFSVLEHRGKTGDPRAAKIFKVLGDRKVINDKNNIGWYTRLMMELSDRVVKLQKDIRAHVKMRSMRPSATRFVTTMTPRRDEIQAAKEGKKPTVYDEARGFSAVYHLARKGKFETTTLRDLFVRVAREQGFPFDENNWPSLPDMTVVPGTKENKADRDRNHKCPFHEAHWGTDGFPYVMWEIQGGLLTDAAARFRNRVRDLLIQKVLKRHPGSKQGEYFALALLDALQSEGKHQEMWLEYEAIWDRFLWFMAVEYPGDMEIPVDPREEWDCYLHSEKLKHPHHVGKTWIDPNSYTYDMDVVQFVQGIHQRRAAEGVLTFRTKGREFVYDEHEGLVEVEVPKS